MEHREMDKGKRKIMAGKEMKSPMKECKGIPMKDIDMELGIEKHEGAMSKMGKRGK